MINRLYTRHKYNHCSHPVRLHTHTHTPYHRLPHIHTHTYIENNLCNPSQSAYRIGHSTETALLLVVNDFLNIKRNGWRQNLCFTLTGSFSFVLHYRSRDSSFPSSNCLWHLLDRSTVVSIIPSGQKSMRCCQQFCFLFFSSHVWCSAGFSVRTLSLIHISEPTRR